jgi:DNA-binding LacI/PurR family transcriptional regulator
MNQTEKVRQKVVFDILNGKYSPGDKLPTERDMAIISKTSRITVRRAYEQLERNGVILRRPKLGTTVAESFKGNAEEIENIAVITTLRDQFSRDFIEAVHEACSDNDILLSLSIAENGHKQNEAALTMAAKGIKNIIIWGLDKKLDFKLFERIRALGVNIVFFDRIIPGAFADYVGLDNKDAMKSLFKDAAKRGIRDYIFVDASGLNIDSNPERLDCFASECQKNNFNYSIFEIPWESVNKPEAVETCKEFFEKHDFPKSTALFCVNDTVALSIISGCPDDIEIYSIDGSAKALKANIKSYHQPIREMAVATVKALKKQQKNGENWKAQNIRFKGDLLSKC